MQLPLGLDFTSSITACNDFPSWLKVINVKRVFLCLYCRLFFNGPRAAERKTLADTIRWESLMMVTFKKKSTSQPKVVNSLKNHLKPVEPKWTLKEEPLFSNWYMWTIPSVHDHDNEVKGFCFWAWNIQLTFQQEAEESSPSFVFFSFWPCTWLSEKHRWPAAQARWWVPCFGP